MRVARLLVALLLALIAQVALSRLLPSAVAWVDPLLVVAVLFALDGRSLSALASGTGAGLLRDVLSGGLYGAFAFADTIVVYLTARAAQRLVIERLSGVFLVLAVASIVQQLVIAGLGALFSFEDSVPNLLALGLGALLNGCLGVAIRIVAGRFRRLRDARRSGHLSRLRF